MFSLSQIVFPSSWILTSCSLAFWLGLGLTAISSTPAQASERLRNAAPPLDRPEAEAAEDATAIEPGDHPSEATLPLSGPLSGTKATESVPELAALAPTAAAPPYSQIPETAAPLADTSTAAPEANFEPSEVQPEGQLGQSDLPIEPPSGFQLSQSDLPIEPPTHTDDPPQDDPPQPLIATDPEACFVECNPSARFVFRPPTATAQSPLIPRVGEATAAAPASAALPPAAASSREQASTQRASGQRSTARGGSIAQSGRSAPAAATLGTPSAQTPSAGPNSPNRILPSSALTPPTLRFQGAYLYLQDESSARARILGIYPLTPRIQVGATVDIITGDGDVFGPDDETGISLNELYLVAAPQNLPNLRFVVGQLDLTSYFDRNSFAKDAVTQFVNPVFQTNPALASAGLGSRQGALINWAITDDLEARAAVFSSDRSISNFELNAFAGEIGLRLGNAIIRGTYVTDRDEGTQDAFEELFSISRGNGEFGVQEGDREEAYGVNVEYFIPEINVGLFGRYGHYQNVSANQGADTYSFGLNVYDLLMENDRLGIAYGQALSNAALRDDDQENPDVLEVFYDFHVLPGLRLGVTFQELNEFTESFAGVRVRTEFDLVPRQDDR